MDKMEKSKTSSDHQGGWKWVAGTFASFLIIWQIVIMILPESRFPAPSQVLVRFVKSFYEPIGKYTLPTHILRSLIRVMSGYFLAAVSGTIFGLLMSWSRVFKGLTKTVFDFLRPIPAIAWIPMAILWFGIEEKSKIFLIFIAAFTPFALSTYRGAMRTDPQLIGAARMLGAKKYQIFWTIVIPSTVPQIFSGAQVALSTGWMAVVGAEMIKSNEGVGWIIMRGSENGDFVQMLVGMVTIAIIGYILATLMATLERRLLRWTK